MSVLLLDRPSVFITSLVWSIISPLLVYFDSYYTHGHLIPMGKTCKTTLNQLSRSWFMFLAELCVKPFFESYFLSSRPNFAHISCTIGQMLCSYGDGDCQSQRSRLYQTSLNFNHMHSPLRSVWLMMIFIHSVPQVKVVWGDLWAEFLDQILIPEQTSLKPLLDHNSPSPFAQACTGLSNRCL